MKAKRRILIAIDRMNIGGAPYVVLEHMRELYEEGYEVHLAMLYQSKKDNLLEELTFLPPSRIHQFSSNRSARDLGTLKEIVRLLKSKQFDVVYTHLFLTNFLVRIGAIIAGVPTILIFEHSRYTDKRLWQRIADHILSRFTDAILVTNETIANFTAKQEWIPREKFQIIRNPISLPASDEEVIDELRNKYDIPNDTRIFLTVGRFSSVKGHRFIIEAVKQVKHSIPDALFLFVGHGPKEEDIRRSIRDGQLQDMIRIIKEPQRARFFYRIADVFILSSTREGQSMVAGEAMLAGLPLIASDLPTIRELIRDKTSGLLFSVGDIDALAEKIQILYTDKRLRSSLGKNAKKRIKYFLQEETASISSLIAKYL